MNQEQKSNNMKIHLIKLITNDDGEEIQNPKWHITQPFGDSDRTLCSGEAYGLGESGAIFEGKFGSLKDCDCPKCLEIVSWFKKLK